MRVLDVKALTPWAVEPATDEQLALERAEILAQAKRFRSVEPTEEQVQALHRRRATSRADVAWLRANLPVGTVFEHLGAVCMVVGHCLADHGLGRDWAAELDMRTPQGVERVRRFVPTMRAMVEPGFVVETTAPPVALDAVKFQSSRPTALRSC